MFVSFINRILMLPLAVCYRCVSDFGVRACEFILSDFVLQQKLTAERIQVLTTEEGRGKTPFVGTYHFACQLRLESGIKLFLP